MKIVVGLITLTAVSNLVVEAVNLARYDKLSKEELLDLDREVTDFYNKHYDEIDTLGTSYDEQIFRSMRAQRHTIVINHFDYRYTDSEVMARSKGAKVDRTKCEIQLRALVEMAKDMDNAPLSVINFIESNGQAEGGILNGNFVWLGSSSTCERARITANSTFEFTKSKEVGEIIGRPCIAHIKAKSWPDWDKYFEERLRIRIGLCLPESCHATVYAESVQVKQDVDFITRYNLRKPFNTDRYSTTYLYCLPDEDSPHRQLDLGSKLLICFIIFWITLTLYTNIKYHQRKNLVRRLRHSVDIRMIISEKRDDYDEEMRKQEITSNESNDDQSAADQQQTSNSKSNTLKPRNIAGGSSSRASSANQTPVPSEIEDNDGEFNAIRPIVINQRRQEKKPNNRRRSQHNGKSHKFEKGIDFLRAFSIQSNLNYLCRKRTSELEARERHANEPSFQQQVYINSRKLSNNVNNRISASNEALIQDLKKDDEQAERKSKVAIISNDCRSVCKYSNDNEDNNLIQDSSDSEDSSKTNKRLNMDVFDGIKVFATAYIVHGHTLMFFFGIVTDIKFATERMLDFTMILCFNTLHVVSGFYIITGALITYLAFSRQKTKELLKPTFWILVIIGRYLRLIPTYLIIFWFARHLSPYTGSGLSWFDYRTDNEHVRGYCSNESWTTMLTMSAADIKVPLDCVPQSWYLSNDFRTLLILPFYVMILAKNVTLGYVALFATFIVSWARLTYILRKANIDYVVLINWQPHVYSILADRLHGVYTDLIVRLSTYLLGCMVGHLLYMYETRQIKQWPDWFRCYGMKVALVVGGIFFMGAPILSNPYVSQFVPDSKDVDSDTAALFIPLFKNAMESCICVILILLVTGGGYKWLIDILSSNVSKILANISYCVFLIHVEIMYKVRTQQIESNYWSLYIHSIFFIVLANFAGFFLHLLYEMPINNMLRYIFQRLLILVKR